MSLVRFQLWALDEKLKLLWVSAFICLCGQSPPKRTVCIFIGFRRRRYQNGIWGWTGYKDEEGASLWNEFLGDTQSRNGFQTQMYWLWSSGHGAQKIGGEELQGIYWRIKKSRIMIRRLWFCFFFYIKFFVSRLSITHILALLSLREERSRQAAAPIKGLGGVVISDYKKGSK